MFWIKNKRNRYTPAYPSFTIYIKVGYKGVYITRTCYPDEYHICFNAFHLESMDEIMLGQSIILSFTEAVLLVLSAHFLPLTDGQNFLATKVL